MKQITLPPLFYVLRHGATDWNDQGLIIGSQDIPLNEKGRARVCKAEKLLRNIEISCVISSPLLRAQESADLIGLPFDIDDRLQEADFGVLEGKPKVVDQLRAWKASTDFQAFKEKVLSAFDARQESTLFITHGHVLEVLLESLGLSWSNVSTRSTKGRPLRFQNKEGAWQVEFL